MKRAAKILLALAFGVMIVSCAEGSTSVSDRKHQVGDSIEGTYTVSAESGIIGYLDLSNSKYSFTTAEGTQIPEWLTEHFFFVKNPEGYYSIEYYGSVDQDSLLEDLRQYEILSYVRFDTAAIGSRKIPSSSRNLFLIRSDKTEKQLYFHSINSEIQMWLLTKPWN